MEWMKTYGKIYGAYMFIQPEIIVADEDILKRVLVKDFHNFTNRRQLPKLSKKSFFNRILTLSSDDDWKNTRQTITPAFTSGKLKGTVHLIDKCVDTLLEVLEKQQDYENGADVKQLMSDMTLDVIGAAAFAMDMDAQRDPNNPFAKQTKDLVNGSLMNWKIILNALFYWTTYTLRETFDIRLFMAKEEEFYGDYLSKVIKERRQTPRVDKLDFLQLMINAVDEEKKENLERDPQIDSDINVSKKWKLTDLDIMAQSWLFVIAGYETTASTLTFSSYLLAWHPEVQEKCYQEINALVNDNERITYDHVQRSMPYLEAVMNETLRIFPPAVRFDRTCQSDYQLTDQLRIPAGTIVNVPVYAIHHSPDFYEDPEKFDPERFLEKDINPLTFLPFGYGPRNCIGMRFAQLEYKLALSNVLRRFKIETCPKTEPMPLQITMTTLLKPKKPILLNFKKRQS